jgi:hypothetical protein
MKSELILYQTEDNRTRIEVRLENETVWLSLNQLAELFQRDKSVISKHIRNVFDESELQPEATVAKYATVQTEGARAGSREIEFYNLDVIIAAPPHQQRRWAERRSGMFSIIRTTTSHKKESASPLARNAPCSHHNARFCRRNPAFA